MDKKRYKMGDDLITVIRELVQVAILTGTNVVDHFRAIEFEIHESGRAVPTEEYLEAYNNMMDKIREEIEKQAHMKELASQTGDMEFSEHGSAEPKDQDD